MHAVDQLSVCDGWPFDGAAYDEVGEFVDPSAAVEAIVPFAEVARQVLGPDAVVSAVEPGLEVGDPKPHGNA